MFCDTVAGANANLYSLIETAKANGIEPNGSRPVGFLSCTIRVLVEYGSGRLPWGPGFYIGARPDTMGKKARSVPELRDRTALRVKRGSTPIFRAPFIGIASPRLVK